MCTQSENSYSVKVVMQCEYEDIDFDISSTDFCEPVTEDIQEIDTTKQLVYYLSEIFGDSIYEFIEQEVFDLLEEIDFEYITEVQIVDNFNNIVYYINTKRKTVDKE